MVRDDGGAPLVEACVDSIECARAAEASGAGRVELCGAGDGGTTPSLGMIARCKDAVDIPVHVMIRPRAGDFVYTDEEFQVMCNDVVGAKGLGADGVVFGMLDPDDTIDTARMATLIGLARPMRVVFHRAFDRTADPDVALDALLELNMDFVLTSGHSATALAGIPLLARHHQRADGRIAILVGGGIRAENVHEVVANTGVREVHARGTDPIIIERIMQALRTH